MARKLVESNLIRSIGYDAETGNLEVEFKNGGIYLYYKVSVEDYTALMRSTSIGSFFSKSIKNKYEFKRLN